MIFRAAVTVFWATLIFMCVVCVWGCFVVEPEMWPMGVFFVGLTITGILLGIEGIRGWWK